MFVVRSFEERDAAATHQLFMDGKILYDNYSEETRLLTTSFAQEKGGPEGDMSHIHAHYIAHEDKRRHFWVAEDNETKEIIGSIATVACTYPDVENGVPSPPARYSFLHPQFQEVFKPLDCLELVRLTVSNRHQRRGIGQALLRAVEAHAFSLGFKTIYLTTLTQMHSAFAFYTKNNFTLLAKELISSEGLPIAHSPFDFEVAHFIRDIKIE